MDQAIALLAENRKSGNRDWSIWSQRIYILVVIALIGCYAGQYGVRFRHWMWDTTVPIRSVSEIDRGYQWGQISAKEGYLNQYEKMQPQQPTDDNWLDYAPLRLAVMTYWGKCSITHFPQVDKWDKNQSFALTAPVLHFNLFTEVIGLICAFFLTRLWYLRFNPAPKDPDSLSYFFRGWIPGFATVLLLWFNPAIVLSAYGWPASDMWIIPPFLLAAFLASVDWWFAAGIAIGIGIMFKGQQIVALPVFILWSLVLFRPMMTIRFLGGVVIAIAIIVSPWLLTFIPADQLAHARQIQATYGQAFNAPLGTFKLARSADGPALTWVITILLASIFLPWVSWLTLKNGVETKARWKKMLASPWAWRAIAAFTAFALVVWPWMLKRNRSDWEIGLSAACLLACCVLLIRPRGIAALAATSTGIALLLCMSLFHGSTAWYDCGIRFGTIHWPKMYVDSVDRARASSSHGLTENLPAVLVNDFDWPMEDMKITFFTIPAHWLLHYPAVAIDISMKEFLQGLFLTTLLLCCLGVGMHARRRDARILIALAAPWLIFFCFLPQIHERYLLFVAGISCICVGTSIGMTLIGILLSIITFAMTLHAMLTNAGSHSRHLLGSILASEFPSLFTDKAGDKLLEMLNGTRSGLDLGYAVVLCGLIFLYFSLAPQKLVPAGRR
jgi:hypothetical protein